MNKKYLIVGLLIFALAIYALLYNGYSNIKLFFDSVLIFFFSVYVFLAFAQDRINSYTNWSLVFWCFGLGILFIVGTGVFLGLIGGQLLFDTVAFVFLVIPGLSFCALVAGFTKGRPKSENIIL